MKLAEIAMTSALCSALFLSPARAQSTSDGSDNSTAQDQAAGAGLQFRVHFAGSTNLSFIFFRYSGYIVSAPPSMASRGMP